MCGIVGIVGNKPVADRLVDGLKRLEYRGYDSAGVATLNAGNIDRRRAPGKLVNLDNLVTENPLPGTIGIGHTRWATHGSPSEANAHPHSSKIVSLVHNGIIENHDVLRQDLMSKGIEFESETDTEVVVQLVTQYVESGLAPLEAVQATCKDLIGAYAFAIIFKGHEDLIIGARKGSPLAIGYGDGEMYLGSDALALSPLTNKIAYLEDGDCVRLTSTSVEVFDETGTTVERAPATSTVYQMPVEKGTYRHFMEKEIFEQPDVLRHTLSVYLPQIDDGDMLKDLKMDPNDISRITIVACGTAYYAGFVAKYWLEQIARIPVELDVASEFRYRTPPMDKDGITIVVSQSGETADTLAALRYAKDQGQTTFAVVNVAESTIDREAHHSFYTHAGPEIGVASTKAFTTQLTVFAMLALSLAQARGLISEDQAQTYRDDISRIPELISQTLRTRPEIESASETLAKARDVLYLGRGVQFPIALEGALKLKEISYIHAEGYAAGEMKHGPIALIDENVPVVVCAPMDEVFEKTLSNMEEVMSRKGQVILVTDKKGKSQVQSKNLIQIEVPEVGAFTSALVYSVPMQLLAYHTATLKGTDVDQPRNLAKSVTVE